MIWKNCSLLSNQHQSPYVYIKDLFKIIVGLDHLLSALISQRYFPIFELSQHRLCLLLSFELEESEKTFGVVKPA